MSVKDYQRLYPGPVIYVWVLRGEWNNGPQGYRAHTGFGSLKDETWYLSAKEPWNPVSVTCSWIKLGEWILLYGE